MLLFCLWVSVFTGCLDTSYRIEQTIKDALSQVDSGKTTAAINKLEALQTKHPNNADIAEALGIAYRERNNHTQAANNFLKSVRLSRNKVSLLVDAANSLVLADRKEDAVERFQEYLELFPEDGESWLLLGRIQYELNQEDEATHSLTRGLLLSSEDSHSVKDYMILGNLYLREGDFPQSDYYFNTALSVADGQPEEPEIVIGLMISSVQQEDWQVASAFLSRLTLNHQDYRSTEEVSRLAELIETMIVQENAAAAERLQESTEEVPNESASTVPDEVEPMAEETTPEAGVDDEPDEAVVDASANEVDQTVSDEDPAVDGSAEDDLSQLEAPDGELSDSQEIDLGADLANMGNANLEETQFISEETDSEGLEPIDSGGDDPDLTGPYSPPENEVDLLVEKSRQLILEGDFPQAIRVAWDAVNKDSSRPSAWFMVSYAYAQYGQFLNAETAALEAMRLNPNNKKIVFHYLSVIQRSQSANRFHDELVRAYNRFSNDPDMILAMARSYIRIKNDIDNAEVLYRRFLELAPNHPRASEVEEELSFVE
jgi:Flp pilus assembly protein TadD